MQINVCGPNGVWTGLVGLWDLWSDSENEVNDYVGETWGLDLGRG